MPRGNVRVSITGDTSGLSTATRRAESDLRRFGTGAEKSTKGVTSAFKVMGAAAISAGAAVGTAGLALGFKKAIDEMRDATKVTAQTNAVIKSTGGVANVTEQQLGKLAERLSMVAGLDDELIQRGANMLLTFKNIRNEVGRNNDIFTQATKATVDMAAAVAAANDSEINLKTASIQVGKALNDPIKGMTALSRVGVTFSESQKKVIERLVEAGDTMGAQKIILRELRSEFAGSAKANADSMDRLKVAVDNLFEKLGKALAPALEDATRWLVRFINQMQRGTGAGGDFVDTLDAIADGFHAIWVVTRETTRSMVRMGDVVLGVLSTMSRGLAKVVSIANKVPGYGKLIDDAWAPALKRSADRVDNLRERLRAVVREPYDVKVNVTVALGPGGTEMRPNDGWGIKGAIDRTVQTAFNRGDLALPFFGGGSAGLMGANANLAPFAALGSRFGLSVTSGYRPGAVTSSGNLSYHAMRRAIDVNAGSPAGMLAYARAMASMFGGQLKELIHTPLGFSIKNGQRVAPYAQAQHYDHVHVALQRGGMVPGSGTGDKVPVLAEPGEGFINSRAVRALGGEQAISAINRMFPRFQKGGVVGKFDATSYGPPWGGIQGTGVTATGVNLKGSPHLHGIAVDPGRLKLGGKYWVWPNPFNYRGPFKAFDTGGAIKGNRIDFYDWRGRSAQLGWGHKDVTVYRGDPWGASGHRGPGGVLTDRPNRGTGPRRHRPRQEPSAPFGGRDIINLGQEKGTGGGGGDLGGGGGAEGGGGDPNQALIDATNAQTAATEAHTQAVNELREQQRRNEQLILTQGSALIGGFIQMVNGGIGGNAGLGRQFPSSIGLGGLARA